MKKYLIILGAMLLTTSVASAHPQPCGCPGAFPPPQPCMHRPAPPKVDLDKKLNLTEEQKIKAKELRIEAHKQIKPLFEQLKIKEDQRRALINGGVNQKEQLDMIADVNKEISTIHKKIHEIRIQNMKDFEAILTPEQKSTLETIKKESRANFKKQHRKFNRPCTLPLK